MVFSSSVYVLLPIDVILDKNAPILGWLDEAD
ncbi:MAG: DUF1232 domain-containing protein [Bacteroidales bacterium]|nr:DUF1232 domain-containing protein [Bacteroidales bacterium]